MSNPFDSIEAKLDTLTSLVLDLKKGDKTLSPGLDPEEVLTVKEAAELLDITRPTLYNLMSKRQVPFMKKGKRCYFLRGELLNYLKQGRRRTVEEQKREADEYDKKRKG